MELVPNVYIEEDNTDIDRDVTVSITGQSRTECILTKQKEGNFTLFTLRLYDSRLIISTLAIFFTEHSSEDNVCYLSSENPISVPVTVVFFNCLITQDQTVTRVYGKHIMINNNGTHLEFDSCTFCNITTSGSPFPFIGLLYVDDFWLLNSSFANIHNLFNGTSNEAWGIGRGSVFVGVFSPKNLTLSDCLFVGCSATHSGGVAMARLNNWSGFAMSRIVSCIFWNNSANYAGDILMMSDKLWKAKLIIQNVSCAYSHGMELVGYGGSMTFQEYLTVDLVGCSFTEITSPTYGGAVAVQNISSLSVKMCHFVRCSAQFGAVLFVKNFSVVIMENSLFWDNYRSGTSNKTGNDVMLHNTSNISITNCFSSTSRSLSVLFDKDSKGSVSDDYGQYANISCGNSHFAGTDAPTGGRCAMPCTADGDRCVKPNECPPGYLAVGGTCVAACSYWVPVTSSTAFFSSSLTSSLSSFFSSPSSSSSFSSSSSSSSSQCSPLCVSDQSLGVPLCKWSCDLRTPAQISDFPCGAECVVVEDILTSSVSAFVGGINGTGTGTETGTGRTCAEHCAVPQHYAADVASNGVCVAKPCRDRQRVIGEERDEEDEYVLQCGPNTVGVGVGVGEGEGEQEEQGCYWDGFADPPHCAEACSMPEFTHPDPRTHVCIWVDCEERTPLPTSSNFPCGVGCVLDSNISPASYSSSSSYFSSSTTTSSSTTSYTSTGRNGSKNGSRSKNKGGGNGNGNRTKTTAAGTTSAGMCASSCAVPQHYADVASTGVCVAKPCRERQRVRGGEDGEEESALQCGPNTVGEGEGEEQGCYWDDAAATTLGGGGSGQCAESCTVPEHNHPDARTHVCKLADCSERTPLPGTADYPCLPGCFADSIISEEEEQGEGDKYMFNNNNNNNNSGRCIEEEVECTGPVHHVKNKTSGRCVFVNNREGNGEGKKTRFARSFLVILIASIGGGVAVLVVAVGVLVSRIRRRNRSKDKGGDNRNKGDMDGEKEMEEKDENNGELKFQTGFDGKLKDEKEEDEGELEGEGKENGGEGEGEDVHKQQMEKGIINHLPSSYANEDVDYYNNGNSNDSNSSFNMNTNSSTSINPNKNSNSNFNTNSHTNFNTNSSSGSQVSTIPSHSSHSHSYGHSHSHSHSNSHSPHYYSHSHSPYSSPAVHTSVKGSSRPPVSASHSDQFTDHHNNSSSRTNHSVAAASSSSSNFVFIPPHSSPPPASSSCASRRDVTMRKVVVETPDYFRTQHFTSTSTATTSSSFSSSFSFSTPSSHFSSSSPSRSRVSSSSPSSPPPSPSRSSSSSPVLGSGSGSSDDREEGEQQMGISLLGKSRLSHTQNSTHTHNSTHIHKSSHKDSHRNSHRYLPEQQHRDFLHSNNKDKNRDPLASSHVSRDSHGSKKSLKSLKSNSSNKKSRSGLEQSQEAVIGEYTVVQVLGRGSFGKVCECVKDGKLFAIKCLAGDSKTVGMELDYAAAANSRLNSKFLVTYHETFRGKNQELYLVMELCRQGDLKSLLEKIRASGKDSALDPLRIIKIMIQLLLGLDVLHRNRIIHRDLKPDNVFIDDEDNVKIGDFGCAKVLETMSERAHTSIGTPLYESPEVVNGETYTVTADLWSLGVLLYELCTLNRPFTNPNRYILIEIIRKGVYQPIPKLRVPEEVREIIYSLLRKNPKERPSAYSILQHPFIREYAEELHLSQYYPASEFDS